MTQPEEVTKKNEYDSIRLFPIVNSEKEAIVSAIIAYLNEWSVAAWVVFCLSYVIIGVAIVGIAGSIWTQKLGNVLAFLVFSRKFYSEDSSQPVIVQKSTNYDVSPAFLRFAVVISWPLFVFRNALMVACLTPAVVGPMCIKELRNTGSVFKKWRMQRRRARLIRKTPETIKTIEELLELQNTVAAELVSRKADLESIMEAASAASEKFPTIGRQ